MAQKEIVATWLAPARVNPILTHPEERRLNLEGPWRFCLDPDDRGLAERWFIHDEIITEPIRVPGSWQGQGFGGDGKDLVWDFRLEARTFRATYQGTGWYALSFTPPDDWQGSRLWLHFGGVHPSAEVWLNGVRLGGNHLPFVPFGLEATEVLRWDGANSLVVRVHEENRELGFAYNWQGNWSGLYRGVELRATGETPLNRCWIHPDVDTERLRISLGVLDEDAGKITYQITAQPFVHHGDAENTKISQGCSVLSVPLWCLSDGRSGPAVSAEGALEEGRGNLELPLPSPALWSPDAPNLYQVDVAVLVDGRVTDAWSERVGFVKLTTQGKHFCLNGEPYYLRGSGDFLSCPETGCPDTDRDRWRRKLKALREYGYNYVRCQSYVYGPEYYDVADEVGLLVQSEMGMLGAWGGHNQWHVYQWPPPTPAYRELLRRQWNRIVERDVNHPSANLYCMSNELGTRTHFPRTAWQCAEETKAIKPTALIIWTDGGLNEDLPQDFVNAEAHQDQDTEKPLIQHEFRWWSSFPDVRIRDKYNGAVRPYAAELALKAAARHGISHVLAEAAEASQRLQFVEAKGKMEACRRDYPRLAGLCHFNAMDTNPSPQGILDEFYERKYADAQTWQQTNGDTVVLCSLNFDDRVRTGGEVLACRFLVSDFSHPPLKKPILEWELAAGNGVFASGRMEHPHEPFCTCPWGEIEAEIPPVDKPVVAQLRATLKEGTRAVTNSWDLWLFPAETSLPEGVVLSDSPQHTWLKTVAGLPLVEPPCPGAKVVLTEYLEDPLVGFLQAGGRVILAASEGLVRPFNPKFGFTLGHYFFTPPANYPPYEDGHDGVLIRPHPLLGDLPHEGFADLQFFRLISPAPPLDLEPLGLTDGEPVIRVMHSYPVGRSLGYLFEGAVGEGRLILCALNLDQSWPEARYLLAQMCQYAANGPLAPAAPLSQRTILDILDGTLIP